MKIEDLLKEARQIWGNQKLSLEEIIIRLNVVVGDISRYARDSAEGCTIQENELKKELGNIIFSTIRWCDDLGYNPKDCLELARQSQIKYRKNSR